MLRFIFLILFLGFSLQAAEPQIILLKLDDVIARRVGTQPVSDRWQKVHDYLIAQGIKGSFGVITESLEKDNTMYFQWLKDVQAAGRIELWMHGYKMRGASDTGEFENGTAAEQRAVLAKGERLARISHRRPLPQRGKEAEGAENGDKKTLRPLLLCLSAVKSGCVSFAKRV